MNEDTSSQLRIWQQNLNKSLTSQLHLLHSARPSDWDIVLIQEPWLSSTSNTRSSHHWNVLYPNASRVDGSRPSRSLIFVNTNIPSDSYTQIKFTSTDVTGLQIKVNDQTFMIINIYNDCGHNDSIDAVSEFLESTFPDELVCQETRTPVTFFLFLLTMDTLFPLSLTAFPFAYCLIDSILPSPLCSLRPVLQRRPTHRPRTHTDLTIFPFPSVRDG